MKEQVEVIEAGRAEDFRLDEFLPYRLSVAAESVSRLMVRQYLAASGLTISEWRLLTVVGRFGVLSPTAAGERTSMDKVKISRAAVSLVSRGLLRQGRDPDDGRGRLLRLTRKGSNSFATVAPTARGIETALAAGLSKTELSTLHKALGKLHQHAQSLLGGNDGEDAE